MLLRFGVSNHCSIREYQELSLVATTLKDSEAGLFEVSPIAAKRSPVSSKGSIRVVPVVAIYGANAAGKSTVLKAFDFFVQGIVRSHERTAASEGTPHTPFLLEGSSKKAPSHYDADFVIGETRYHYGYSVDGKVIVSEWLYSFPLNTARQVRTVLFYRSKSEENEFYFGKALKGDNKRISKLTRPNSLFMSAAAQNAHPQLVPVFDFFFKKVSRRIEEPQSLEVVSEQLSVYFSDDEKRRTQVLNFLRAADIGIKEIDFSKTPIGEKEKLFRQDFEQILSKHIKDPSVLSGLKSDDKTKVELLHHGVNGESIPIPLRFESAGTLSLLQLLGPVFSRLEEGGVLLVDELNNTLHPLVSRELIRLFSSPDTNPGKAQLIFTTHDTGMLSCGLLRRDQIWFAEKDNYGATHIYALSSIKIRASDNIERGYISGRFGAIPLFGIRGFDSTLIGVASDLSEKAE